MIAVSLPGSTHQVALQGMLERYDGKLSRTVPRGGEGREPSALPGGIKHRGKREYDGARPESFLLRTTVHQSVLERDQQDWRTVTVSPADIVASVRE